MEDIAELCQYAHRFGAKVHVTLNTIVYEDEVDDMIALVKALEKAKVDALLIQDMGLLKLCKEQIKTTITLHASTQCDSRTKEKVEWLAAQGFERVVLARELSVKEIEEIHKAVPNVELEAFVHGALCVSYSGICYASQHCFGRSANRGACSQFCRMAFDLKDADGRMIEQQRYLLSLKDMSQIDNLEVLMRSGACSFKIEGRLKDINYVKNVVSAYNKRLNDIIARHKNEFCRASLGQVECNFTPDLNKTFNRGYTNYFLKGRQPNIFSPNTPKALGEYVGRVKEIRHDSFNVSSTASFANGDGLCFINHQATEEGRKEVLEGFRVNRAVGNRLYPYKMPHALKAGMSLYRNQDQAFEKELSGQSAVRKLPVTMVFDTTEEGFSLTIALREKPEICTTATIGFNHQAAQKPQSDNICRQLTKLGNTIYECNEVGIAPKAAQWFVPSSVLAELRRTAIEQLEQIDLEKATRTKVENKSETTAQTGIAYVNPKQYERFPYLYNIANRHAYAFYEQQGMAKPQPAFECTDTKALKAQHDEALVMQCRHCIRFSLGYCVINGGKKPTWKEPLYLELGDKRKFRLEFDCKHCQMNIYAE